MTRTALLKADASARSASAPGLAADPLQDPLNAHTLEHAVSRGLSGAAGPLPHAERIQASFGRHDVSKVVAHGGPPAREGAAALGARGFATGSHVVFREAPDMFTAAHEAAHVVQQQGGVQLAADGGGQRGGLEDHADQVAEKVVRGESAEPLLDRVAPGGTPSPAPTAGATVQLLRDRYDFAGGERLEVLTNQHRGVYLLRANGEEVVVKYEAGGHEVGLQQLAAAVGLHAPQIRRLTEDEVEELRARRDVGRPKGNCVVMEFVQGEALDFLHSSRANDAIEQGLDPEAKADADMLGLFTRDVLRDIGRSYAFQILTGSADRWPMPESVGVGLYTDGNAGNVLIDGASGHARDIDFTQGRPGADYVERMAEHLRGLLEAEDGGDLVRRVSEFIGSEYRAKYEVPAEGRVSIKEGFIQAMDAIRQIDLDDFEDLGRDIQARARAIQEAFHQEAEALDLQAANQAETGCRCVIQ